MKEALDLLLSKGTFKEYKKKDFLIVEGQVSKKVYFLKHGVVRHYVITHDGNEKTIRLSKENAFFYSSIVSYFTNEQSYIFCQCLTKAELIYWDFDKIEQLFVDYPKLGDFRNKQLMNFILEKHRKEIALLTQSAEKRYIGFFNANMELFNRIPHHIIASYLDIAPETLSRLRAKKS
jgi:CRP-like cAMP-binding protein